MSNTFQEIEWSKIRNRDDAIGMVKIGSQWVSLEASREMKRHRKSLLDWLSFGGLLALLSIAAIGALWAYGWGCQRIIEGIL